MATVAKHSAASFDASTGMVAPQVSHEILGEDVTAVTPLTMKADGKLWKASGAAANRDAKIYGWSTRAGKAGQTCTVYGLGAIAKYANVAQAPGAILYLSATPGALDDAPTTGDAVGCAQVTSDGLNIRITRNI
jgi:hypothetical protein